jgi:hypothetical protein
VHAPARVLRPGSEILTVKEGESENKARTQREQSEMSALFQRAAVQSRRISYLRSTEHGLRFAQTLYLDVAGKYDAEKCDAAKCDTPNDDPNDDPR